MLTVWGVAFLLGAGASELKLRLGLSKTKASLKPSGLFYSVSVAVYSLGSLPLPPLPRRISSPVVIYTGAMLGIKSKSKTYIKMQGRTAEVLNMLTPVEKELAEELFALLLSAPNHYAGAGHGVGLLEHSLNVLAETATRCTEELRLPFIAALAHDVGKLVTFVKVKGSGENGTEVQWERKGWHTRESGRLLATLPAFEKLPLTEQRALILAIKYDHSPELMPVLADDDNAFELAKRIMMALGAADRAATAAEKDRNLQKIKPQDILWDDFAANVLTAPLVQRASPGARSRDNQINFPAGSPYLFVYEMTWREAAIRRLPEEVAAALDLTRRDSGKLAKYTGILTQILREKGLLIDKHIDDKDQEWTTPENLPLWDVMSGTTEIRGVLVIDANKLWEVLNRRITTHSPYPVTLARPTADSAGAVYSAPSSDASAAPEVTDGLKVDMDAMDLSDLGLEGPATPEKENSKAKENSTSDTTESAQAPKELNTALENVAPAASRRRTFTSSVMSSPSSSQSEEGVLTQSEINQGVLLADEQAVSKFPHLSEGDKYFGPTHFLVTSEAVKEGAAFPLKKEKESEKEALPGLSAPSPDSKEKPKQEEIRRRPRLSETKDDSTPPAKSSDKDPKDPKGLKAKQSKQQEKGKGAVKLQREEKSPESLPNEEPSSSVDVMLDIALDAVKAPKADKQEQASSEKVEKTSSPAPNLIPEPKEEEAQPASKQNTPEKEERIATPAPRPKKTHAAAARRRVSKPRLETPTPIGSSADLSTSPNPSRRRNDMPPKVEGNRRPSGGRGRRRGLEATPRSGPKKES